MIQKPTIMVTSLGRTGTLFFSRFFQLLFPHITSLHEPDILSTHEFHNLRSGFASLRRQFNEAGFYNKVVRKFFGNWSLASVSDSRVNKTIGYKAAVDKVIFQREKFIQSRIGSVYAESSLSLYGLIDVVQGTFQNHKIVYIVRDGREWVRSTLHWDENSQRYGKGKIREMLSHHWPTPRTVNDDQFIDQWQYMGNFEKLCWQWSYLNKYAVSTISLNPDAKLFYFEDLFQSSEKNRHMMNLLEHVSSVSKDLVVNMGIVNNYIDKPIHASTSNDNSWEYWSTSQREQFIYICGPVMKELGYEFN